MISRNPSSEMRYSAVMLACNSDGVYYFVNGRKARSMLSAMAEAMDAAEIIEGLGLRAGDKVELVLTCRKMGKQGPKGARRK